MDIEKDSNREAFEAWFESRYDAHFMQFALDLDFYVDKHTQTCWEAWQAAKAQAVPDGFVVVPVQCPDPDFADMLFDELSKNAIGEFGDDLLIHFSDIDEEKIWDLMLEAAQEPAMTENTIRCTNCGLEFESDYDLEQNLIDPETGEIHDGCPTCKTDAYLMDLVKYPDLEPAND